MKNFSFKSLVGHAALVSMLSASIGVHALTIQSVTREFNALSHLTKETFPDGRWISYEYDANGNRITMIESMPAAATRTTRYAYDEFNRLRKIIAADGGVTRMTYDARDNLVTVTDPLSLSTTYTYNGFDNLLKLVSPDTGTTSYSVNPQGMTVSQTDARNKTIGFVYDNAGRVTQRTEVDQTINFTWDTAVNGQGQLARSKLVRGTELVVTETPSYDTLGRLSGNSQSVALNGGTADVRNLSYAYNSAGQLSRITYPSGTVVDYTYAAAPDGRLLSIKVNNQIQDLLSGISWRGFGGVNGWTWGNGLIHSRSYDQNGRLTNLKHGTLFDKTLGWDVGDRIVSSTDPIASRTQTYGYDSVDRLTQTLRNTTTDNYSYDLDGNRKTNSWGATSNTYGYPTTSNRLSQVIETSSGIVRNLGYDAAGNQITDDRSNKRFLYNNAGRLIKVINLTGSSTIFASYGYNADGERVFKQANGSTQYFVYDTSGHLLGEYDSTGAYQEHIWLDDIPVANLRVNQAGQAIQSYYVLADHLGTPRAIVDPTLDLTTNKGRVLWRWEGEAFGNTPPAEDADANGVALAYQLRFPGQYADKETGKNYNYFRDYDPAIGRYIESDPIGLGGGVNTYGYVGGYPLDNYDSTGEAEHTTNRRPSTKEKHQQAEARRQQDRGGEAGDRNRGYPRKRPDGRTGSWPPKAGGYVSPALLVRACLVTGSAYVGWKVGGLINEIPVGDSGKTTQEWWSNKLWGQ